MIQGVGIFLRTDILREAIINALIQADYSQRYPYSIKEIWDLFSY